MEFHNGTVGPVFVVTESPTRLLRSRRIIIHPVDCEQPCSFVERKNWKMADSTQEETNGEVNKRPREEDTDSHVKDQPEGESLSRHHDNAS